jgi:outer membrane cobalamin receptor
MSETGKFTASYTYLDVRDRTTDERVTGIPRQQIRFATEGKVDKWKAVLSAWMNGDMLFKRNSWDTVNSKTSFTPIFDLSFVYMGHEKLQPYVTIRNLTNIKYQETPGYDAEGQSIEAGIRSSWN